MKPAVFLLAILLPLPLAAQDLPPGVTGARFLPGWIAPDGTRMTALQLTMEPDWKTYWRSPGDAGIPPVFNWSGSENIGEVEFHWPSPEVFESAGMRTLGFHDELVLPIEISPADPARPVHLQATVDLGVCQDICVPVHLEIAPADPGQDDPLIRKALARQPRDAFFSPACELSEIADGMRLTARLVTETDTEDIVAAMELAGDADVWVSSPDILRRGNRLTVSAEFVDASGAPFPLDPQALRLTVITPFDAQEFNGCSSVLQP